MIWCSFNVIQEEKKEKIILPGVIGDGTSTTL